MTPNQDMLEYYRQRAAYYERVYDYPERQADLAYLKSSIVSLLKARRVFEVAAGTGYWSRSLVPLVESLCVTDANQAVLDVLHSAQGMADVDSKIIDAYDLADITQRYSGFFAGCWLSHVPVEKVGEFFAQIHSVLEPGAKVVLLDNSMAQYIRLPIVFTDKQGNTYQDREIDDGSVHRVLKNFPSEDVLAEALKDSAKNFHFEQLENYWLCHYDL